MKLRKQQLETIVNQLNKILLRNINVNSRKVKQAKTVDDMRLVVSINPYNIINLGTDIKQVSDLFNKAIRLTVKGLDPNISAVLTNKTSNVAFKYLDQYGADLSNKMLTLIDEGLKKELMPDMIRQSLIDQLNVDSYRAKMIARTEVMRASNTASYTQARQEDKQYYIVDNRAEACETCQDIGESGPYEITDTDNLPPIHPNCACIAVFFNTLDEETAWQEDIQSTKSDIRDDIIDNGGTIKPDGTSSQSNN